ncbi:P-loop containing nucleoside triphosphate hydrolase protein [Mycena pura]|uniref:DNA 3'-5' helicase n=1 Tax=Mycena pura TaxID=153505 RepID=A0AAD6UWD8_9AGAR|nr:P-loop containing nucleoside triphosphate hydrolase protein [Mycena pura]
MAPRLRWQDELGRKTIGDIVKKVIPAWTDGLRPVQEDLVSAILDGDDVLCCTATGDGKSAAFSIPILVLDEYAVNPQLYPAGLRSRIGSVGVVVTPTKGLANNIVLELVKLGLSAFAYSSESLADARRKGLDLTDAVKSCKTWRVICVDPEHLRDTAWRAIAEWPAFRAKLLYSAVDEVHLIKLWGLEFRKDFGLIGQILRGCFPSSASVVGLSATLAPGADTSAKLTHGLAGYEFPDLLPFLRSGRKLCIHCATIDLVFRVYVYIWRLQSSSADKFRRTRMYHSLCPPEYNEETIRLIDTDPYCQIIVCTIAFANGINAKSILDSISLGFGDTLDIEVQKAGRPGRAPETTARAIILFQPSAIATATKQLHGASSDSF